MKAALDDGRMWCKVGVVKTLAGEDQAWEFVEDENGNKIDVIVGVKLGHTGEEIYARLGQGGGTMGRGIWKIPAVGTEVAVMIPEGDLAADPMIVATLSTNAVPQGLDEDTFVMVNPKKVLIYSENDKVYIGSPDGSGTKPLAFKTGNVDLGTWACTAVPAGPTAGCLLTLTWTPPSGSNAATFTLATATLGPFGQGGVITDGSATAEVKP